jgi:hypothetical protein
MTTATHSLLTEALDAHGGMNRWHQFSKVKSRVVSGGFLWSMKGFPLDDTPRSMTSEFRRQCTRVEPFGQADWHMLYEPHRVVIETSDGETVAQQDDPRETFASHVWETPWTALQLAYFNGYAMWTYYNLPFLLGDAGVEATEIPTIVDSGTVLRGLRVRLPPAIHSHSPEQNVYFDDSGLLRRQDYTVDVAGRKRAAHLISDYVDVQGLLFPARRRVFVQNADGTLQDDKVLVSIDLSEFELS